MDEILIGINRKFATGLEAFLGEYSYSKDVEGDIVYFELAIEGWDHPHNPVPSEIMSYLFLVVGVENYGFVRFGDSVDDTEIQGTLKNFDISVCRTICRS